MAVRHRSGFTLIELLVVIAIIAILAAILFPVFAQAREKARQASCLSNVRQMSMAIQQYQQDYDQNYPLVSHGVGVFNPGTSEWQNAIYPYVKNEKVYRCPSDSSPGMNLINPADTGGTGDRQATSYLLNDNLTFNPSNGVRQSISEATIAAPAQFLVLGEGHRAPTSTYDPGTQAVDWAGRPQSIWCREQAFRNLTDVFFGVNSNARTVPNVPHHPAGLHFAFGDGHVKFYAVNTAETLQGTLPYVTYAVPNQQGGSLIWQ